MAGEGMTNISEDTQEMPQSRGTAFPRHQKERLETNKDKTKRHICNHRRLTKENLQQ